MRTARSILIVGSSLTTLVLGSVVVWRWVTGDFAPPGAPIVIYGRPVDVESNLSTVQARLVVRARVIDALFDGIVAANSLRIGEAEVERHLREMNPEGDARLASAAEEAREWGQALSAVVVEGQDPDEVYAEFFGTASSSLPRKAWDRLLEQHDTRSKVEAYRRSLPMAAELSADMRTAAWRLAVRTAVADALGILTVDEEDVRSEYDARFGQAAKSARPSPRDRYESRRPEIASRLRHRKLFDARWVRDLVETATRDGRIVWPDGVSPDSLFPIQ